MTDKPRQPVEGERPMSPMSEHEQVERWALEKRDGQWTVLAAPPTPTTFGARVTVIRADPIERQLQSQRKLTEEAEERAERAESLVRRYQRPFVDGGLSPAERRQAMHQRMVKAEHRAEEAEAERDEAYVRGFREGFNGAEDQLEAAERQIDEYRERLEEIVKRERERPTATDYHHLIGMARSSLLAPETKSPSSTSSEEQERIPYRNWAVMYVDDDGRWRWGSSYGGRYTAEQVIEMATEGKQRWAFAVVRDSITDGPLYGLTGHGPPVVYEAVSPPSQETERTP